MSAREVYTLVVGSMIGSGIFLVTPGILRDTGHPIWLMSVWILSGLITLAGALSYAELAAMLPYDGGQMVFIREAWGSAASFAYGMSVVLGIQTGVIAAVATAFAIYLAEIPLLLGFNGFASGNWMVRCIAVGMIMCISLIQMRGLKSSARIQNFFTFSKIAALAMVILLGMIAFSEKPEILLKNFSQKISFMKYSYDSHRWNEQQIPVWLMYFFSACIGALFSMDAWNNVTFLTSRVENPSRNMPKGLVAGVLTVTVLYALTNLSYFAMIPSGTTGNSEVLPTVAFPQSDRVATASLSVFFGNFSALVVAVFIVLSTFGCNNGIILSGSVFIQTMAKWKWLPSFIKIENQHKAPVGALIVQAIWASMLVFTGSYRSLLIYATFSSLFFYLMTIAGMMKLRTTKPDTHRPYKCPAYPWLPVFYLIMTTCVCITLMVTDTFSSLIGLLIPFFAFLFYLLYKKKNEGMV